MVDEDGTHARRAADAPSDAPGRPKRFVTPDWDDWDGASGDSASSDSASEDSPADTTEGPVPGGRFADSSPAPRTPAYRGGRFSSEPSQTPAPTVSASRARHAFAAAEDADAPAGAAQQPHVPSEVAAASPEDAPARTIPEPAAPSPERTDWHPIPVEPVPGAAHAAQSPSLGEKRRREAPALPVTPAPLSPAERREAAARERTAPVAPGTKPTDDWTGAPLPATAVPPPSAGQAPAPIEVQTGEAPVAHRAYARPAGDDEAEDTLWLTRRPTSRAAEEAVQAQPTAAPTQPPADVTAPYAGPTSTPAFVPAAPATPAAQASPASIATPVSASSLLSGPAMYVPSAPLPSGGEWQPFVPQPTGTLPGAGPALHGAEPVGAPGSAPFLPPQPSVAGPGGIDVPEPGGLAADGGTVPPVQPVRRRWWRRRPLQISAAALVLVVALVAGFLVWSGRNHGGNGGSGAAASLVNDLVTADQLSGVGPGQWTEQKTESTVTQDSPAPVCYVAAPDLPTPTLQVQRKLTATGATALHRIVTYASAEDASKVYALRTSQLGQCANIPIYLVSGAAITSLGDQAVGITAVIQDTTAQYHTEVVVRTGSTIITYDIAQVSSAVTYDKVLPLASTTVRSVCSSAGGGCTANPTATTGVPPTGSTPGWLSPSDLPRVTAGMGRWGATTLKTTVTSLGSGCENVTFATVAGPNQRRQRTYLLTEDTKAPTVFGIDEIVLDFDTADAASAFATQLKTSISECQNRSATAKLGNDGAITATGSNGEAITGFWRTLTQNTNATTTFVFRVGVATSGTRVVYLLATPTATFDFADADWSSITARAGQRATQGG